MKIDLNTGSVNKLGVLRWYNHLGHLDKPTSITIAAEMSQVPCLVIAFWIGETLDFPDWIVNKILMYIDDYRYTQIINLPENTPSKILEVINVNSKEYK